MKNDAHQYLNPPVVEVAITFEFMPSNETLKWSKETGNEFVDKFSELPKRGYAIRQSVPTPTTSKDGIPEFKLPSVTFSEVCCQSNDMTRILGVGENYLTCHILRNESIYPHYSEVKEMICRYLPEYQIFWKSGILKKIGLSYIDEVIIPKTDIDLDEYFQFGISGNSNLGKLEYFDTTLHFPSKSEYGIDLKFQFRCTTGEINNYSYFHIFWNCIKNICDPNKFDKELDDVHIYIRSLFEKSLTDKCKKLFN
ncbi:MAG: TIGR04255 family protein [Bacteroidales bacterium]|jgi:uncharacterized protein (TIGR04255 family)|nr:TIGR04255 family protein [Bacteroidales bacterium]